MKSFHVGDIVSVATGVLVSPRHIGGVCDLLNYLTGDEIYTHQIPRVCQEVIPWLHCQFPWLEKLDYSGVNETNWQEWLSGMVSMHGETHYVSPLPEDWHTHIDPVEEAGAMLGDARVIVVDPDKEQA